MRPEDNAVGVDDGMAFPRLSAVLRDWEPSLELYRPPTDALLYEPDGTLYAVCLAGSLSIRVGDRVREVRRGDLLVVPRAYALDAGPVVDLLALRHDGPAPDHFRERFIQVWGFEHIPAPRPADVAGLAAVTAYDDTRYRVPYAVIDVPDAKAFSLATSGDVRLLVTLDGVLNASVTDGGRVFEVTLPARTVLALSAGAGCRLAGPGRGGVVTILHELAHEARRGVPGRGPHREPGPEYVPPPAT